MYSIKASTRVHNFQIMCLLDLIIALCLFCTVTTVKRFIQIWNTQFPNNSDKNLFMLFKGDVSTAEFM
jgi:hypothetical protein